MATKDDAVNLERSNLADMDMSNSPNASRSPVPTFPSKVNEMPWVFPADPSVSQPNYLSTGSGSDTLAYEYSLMMAQLNPQYPFANSAGLPDDFLVSSSSVLGIPNVAVEIGRQKEPIRLKGAVMYPPNPNAPLPPLRGRPPACRTIFIGGLPEKCTKEILVDLLARCGEVQSVRMSKKYFAHVRFVSHDSVDRALYFTGYRMKVDDRSEKEYTGRIHIDYAQARDDTQEWEREQRAMEREQRHRAERSGSPTVVVQFVASEAATLLEKLKGTEAFFEASQTLMSWLDKGDCSKRTSTVFYSMIGAVNAHVRRVLQEKVQYENEFLLYKEQHSIKLNGLVAQLCQIEKVFRMARKQRNWDHFSRAQRKNVDAWLSHVEAIRKDNENELLRDRHEEEMETCDDDSEQPENADEPQPHKKFKFDASSFYQRQSEDLRAENVNLKAQIEELKNQIQNTAEKSKIDENTSRNSDSLTLSTENVNLKAQIEKLKNQMRNTVEKAKIDGNKSNNSDLDGLQKEARFIALLACFLNVHPAGATVDYMWAYLREFAPDVRNAEIEDLLEKHSNLFKLQCSGVGARYERKWIFIGFKRETNAEN